jgi:hypothetical protein
MKLTALACRNATPTDKAYKLADGAGMFLLVQPSGARYCLLKYRYAGKEKLLALRVCPETSLSEARQKRDAASKLLDAGEDPANAERERKRRIIEKSEQTFERNSCGSVQSRGDSFGVSASALAQVRRPDFRVIQHVTGPPAHRDQSRIHDVSAMRGL